MERTFSRLLILTFSLFAFVAGVYGQKKQSSDGILSLVKGTFSDDYGIRYQINDSLWTQLPDVKYHIITWDTAGQYLLARNDSDNPSEKGLYTRIDYMAFTGMAPYSWGFCLTVYNAKTVEEAKEKANVDRDNPRKGCNGFPFSRMRSVD